MKLAFLNFFSTFCCKFSTRLITVWFQMILLEMTVSPLVSYLFIKSKMLFYTVRFHSGLMNTAKVYMYNTACVDSFFWIVLHSTYNLFSSIIVLFQSCNSNSVSNVSSSLSEHLRNLVRAFSSRTEKVKETTLQPPSPSSLSDYAGSDALSGIYRCCCVDMFI